MAQKQPQTLKEFAKISGVGSHKRDRYGTRFTAEIRAFCEEQGIPLRSEDESDASEPAPSPDSPEGMISTTHLHTLDLHQQGLSPAEIAEQRNFRLSTIFDHLGILMEAGQRVDLDSLVSPERQAVIEEAIAITGPDSLRLIREHLGEAYSYPEIRLVRAAWRRSHLTDE